MTKVQAQCLKVAIQKGDMLLAVKLALMANLSDGGKTVYLPNAYDAVQHVITLQQWAGYLGALATEGFYSASQDPEYAGYWGYVHQGQ
jgi:hypothetical protein